MPYDKETLKAAAQIALDRAREGEDSYTAACKEVAARILALGDVAESAELAAVVAEDSERLRRSLYGPSLGYTIWQVSEEARKRFRQ